MGRERGKGRGAKAMTEAEVQDKIAEWHASPLGVGPLWEFLGWTWEQYKDWFEKGRMPKP
jgi:hypothetical protein